MSNDTPSPDSGVNQATKDPKKDKFNQIKDGKKKEQNRAKNDQERDRRLYEYLLTLTDNSSQSYSESRIAEQWGLSDNRIFISRVMKSILIKTESEDLPVVPGITLNKLVLILKNIDKYRYTKNSQQIKIKFPRVLTRAEKLKALHLYADTLPEEKKVLDLVEYDGQLLLKQLIEDITDPRKNLPPEKINEIYKYVLSFAYPDTGNDDLESYNIENIINSSIKEIGCEYFQGLNENSLIKLKTIIFEKVNKAIKDIGYQNGSYQFKAFLDRQIESSYSNISERKNKIEQQMKEIGIRFSPKKFIKRLTKSIIEHQVLAQEFSVHMKNIEIQEVQQFASQERDSSNNRLFAYTVKVNFYLENTDEGRIDFYEEVTGIGSPLSHAIAAMNRALLWDIKSLNEYVPIAKQITFDTEIIGSGNNGSIWGHYVVGLCKRKNIDYEKNSCSVEELASGDYCGFDTLEVYAKASFYARLKAIKKTGISPSAYVKELQEKIKQVKILRAGEKMLNEYPFSLEAMKSYLTTKMLTKCYDLDENNFPVCSAEEHKIPWSLTEYEAHLSITEAYLKEGLYAIGKKYLDCIKKHIDESDTNPISRIIIARYYLCCFRYYYLTDLHDENSTIHNRDTAVKQANLNLEYAYQNLKQYIYKCNIIDELPHVNFYSFSTVMSNLYAHRAKLCFFMGSHIQQSNNIIFDSSSKELVDPIKLFEQARIYAARSGDPSLYSIWSAYQSWCYLVDAHTKLRDKRQEKEQYINTAEEVLIDALNSYQKTGEKNYESIKLRSGKENRTVKEGMTEKVEIGYEEDEDYGEVKIQGIPWIKEFTKNDNYLTRVQYSPKEGSLSLDMSLLTSDLGNSSTLLFGTQSSILIFARAMLKLCHYNYSNSSIFAEVETAKIMFSYSWAFAEDGVYRMENNEMSRWDDSVKKEDDDKENDVLSSQHNHRKALESRCLRGLYPHRLTQFADFGKIYFIACELILLSQHQDSEEKSNRLRYIDELIETLITKNFSKARAAQTKQTRYNGHLQDHFDAIDKYIKAFRKIEITSPIETVRDQVVKDIANILRTGQTQVPNIGTGLLKS
jgi:hypothetical protein